MIKGKEKDRQNIGGNGQNDQSATLTQLLQTIAQQQQELSDRLSELEEMVTNRDRDNTKIQLAHMYMKPPKDYLVDLSRISPLAARPIAEALALDEMTSPRVRSGEISLNRLVIENWLHALRGVRGFILHLVADAMKEQVSAEATKEDEEMPEFQAGRE